MTPADVQNCIIFGMSAGEKDCTLRGCVPSCLAHLELPPCAVAYCSPPKIPGARPVLLFAAVSEAGA